MYSIVVQREDLLSTHRVTTFTPYYIYMESTGKKEGRRRNSAGNDCLCKKNERLVLAPISPIQCGLGFSQMANFFVGWSRKCCCWCKSVEV